MQGAPNFCDDILNLAMRVGFHVEKNFKTTGKYFGLDFNLITSFIFEK